MKYLLTSFFLSVLLHLAFPSNAEDSRPQEKEKNWWQLRHDRSDIFYPHKIHLHIMQENGDSCMLCHPFSKNTVDDKKILQQLNQINNEPLEAICHDCHVDKINAPSECRLCHPDPSSIWPDDHNYNYKMAHANDAQADQNGCSDCHKQLSFCADCHFERNTTGLNTHQLGYKSLHGLDARIAPTECAACHQPDFCIDCHRSSR
jgi:hypothetical protein